MSFNFYKQDRRHQGSRVFGYAVSFSNNDQGIREFTQIRRWCWETFGPSVEIGFYKRLSTWGMEQPQWCWVADEYTELRIRIYFKDSQSYNLALLKWQK